MSHGALGLGGAGGYGEGEGQRGESQDETVHGKPVDRWPVWTRAVNEQETKCLSSGRISRLF
jgi:hypothetical protein